VKAKRSDKRGLGKGLSALIPTPVPESEGGAVQEIGVDEIRPNSLQPRQVFADDKLAEMAESIRAHGILQPVVVRSIVGGYELVAGERRWRAAQMAGVATIPAVVRELSEAEMVEIALIENIQREDLNPLEEAEAFRVLISEYGLTQEQLSQRVGKSRSHIANLMRLLNLSPQVQEYVSRGTISMGHARALLALAKPEAQIAACEEILNKGLSVRQTEELLRRPVRQTPIRKRAAPDPWLRDLEANLEQTLSTKVRIRTSGEGGRIEIEYFSADELERLIELLQG
jgi:ParB family chromosome partitioning protein